MKTALFHQKILHLFDDAINWATPRHNPASIIWHFV